MKKRYSIREALDIFKCIAWHKLKPSDEEIEEAVKAISYTLEQQAADGCQGCAFTDVEEWEMPCRKCKRACKDYWRPAKDE